MKGQLLTKVRMRPRGVAWVNEAKIRRAVAMVEKKNSVASIMVAIFLSSVEKTRYLRRNKRTKSET